MPNHVFFFFCYTCGRGTKIRIKISKVYSNKGDVEKKKCGMVSLSCVFKCITPRDSGSGAGGFEYKLKILSESDILLVKNQKH